MKSIGFGRKWPANSCQQTANWNDVDDRYFAASYIPTLRFEKRGTGSDYLNWDLCTMFDVSGTVKDNLTMVSDIGTVRTNRPPMYLSAHKNGDKLIP